MGSGIPPDRVQPPAQPRPGISIGGHIGGLIAGVIAAYVLVTVGDRARSFAVPVLVCVCLAGAEVAASIAVA